MPILCTIGYGGRKPSELIEALNEYEIHWVVDVRLTPGAYLSTFRAGTAQAGGGLENLLEPAIGYRWMRGLGNRYKSHLEYYKEYLLIGTGHESKGFAELISKLEFVTKTRVCLLCAERKAEECHRRIIAEEAVKKLNELKVTQTKWKVVHIE